VEKDKALDEISRCFELAVSLHIPNIRLRANPCESIETAVRNTYEVISAVLPVAEEKGVTLLLETTGAFSNTKILRELLDRFASDYVAALWQMSAAYFGAGETAEEVIKNLGAYVRHVQFNDARMTENGLEYCLAGEGTLPVSEMMLALRSVNFDGYVSLVWDPTWCEELDDMEIIFSQFVGFMKQFGDTSRNEKTLYYNRARTGKFVWKKDLLIDMTFSGVLDRMVEEFPDQYAFKYTTLDYTRTYSEFRDDVDTFARSEGFDAHARSVMRRLGREYE
jgi:fatty-acyl-CoA synthase